ncbi:glyoxalase/bleomycin resistance protein/dioxygenase superfamily protein [Pseudonocardia kunmingensis]|uniref:Glyoxalase/bleomycin resistance protein/dioxygenase superfamily protein n=1 Tax=Pseudonocardia kunmingensis TaxID=630975 RepID=A0A543DPU3_9PSEU|nr:glyoxalase/bleomycin resistance protein/dioxygenase superfamily protein [Pseudonocardia kunmingensis]
MHRLQPAKLVHVNHLVDDFAGTTAFYTEVCGAREYWRGYDEEQRRDANLMVIGELCVELFAPVDRSSLLGASLSRYGPGWHSFEWQVPDLEEAKDALDARGVRVTTYRPGAFLMAHPADCHGMLLELCPLEMSGDPRIEPDWSAAPWRDEHPLGVTGLNALSVAVRDLAAASAWILDLVSGAEVVYREFREEADADAVGVRVADHVVEFVQARSERGPIAEFVARYGQRLRAVELGVLDPDRAARHLVSAGYEVVPGARAGALSFEVNGARWELAEQRGR